MNEGYRIVYKRKTHRIWTPGAPRSSNPMSFSFVHDSIPLIHTNTGSEAWASFLHLIGAEPRWLRSSRLKLPGRNPGQLHPEPPPRHSSRRRHAAHSSHSHGRAMVLCEVQASIVGRSNHRLRACSRRTATTPRRQTQHLGLRSARAGAGPSLRAHFSSFQ